MSTRAKLKKPKSNERPFVFLNIAATADGKIAPANRHLAPFSSKRDHDLLYELRTRADAVMAGARTVDSALVTLGTGGKKYRERRVKNGLAEYHLRIVVSGSGSIDSRAAIFRKHFSPLIVIVSETARRSQIAQLEKLGAIVHVCGGTRITFKKALKWLHEEWNVKRLLCEGGGEVNAALFRENLVDELNLTLCPKIFGGRNAPTLADGFGIESLHDATLLKLKTQRRVGDEMFLTYLAK